MPDQKTSTLPQLSWTEGSAALERVTFRLEAGPLLGTAFLVSMAAAPDQVGRHGYIFATARHVLKRAVKAQQRLQLYTSDGRASLGSASVICHHIGPRASTAAF